MNTAAIYHRADSEQCYLTDAGRMVITLQAARGDLSRVLLVYDDRYDAQPKREPRRLSLELYQSGPLHDIFAVEFDCPFSRLGYYFLLTDQAGQTLYFYQDGFATQYSWGRQRQFQLPFLQKTDTPHVPLWLKESVAYQIFPDSFAQSWEKMEEKPAHHVTEEGIRVQSRLGGTLRGIIDNLPYLADLGINLLYLNPIFVAEAYHKYDILDYYHIDPCLGTDADFRELVEKCHAADIRVMLDLVFNHCSDSFFAFRDIQERGAASRYADWFCIHGFPVKDKNSYHYESFAFLEHMPKLNPDNPETGDYLLDIGRYWLREYQVDGYRLDVANEVSHSFWKRFRMEMEAVRPDVAIIGEVWHEAHAWVGRDQFHSVMNYPLLYAIWGFFGQDSLHVQEFSETIGRLALLYRRDNVEAMMNFLDNHDICRFFSIGGKERPRHRLAAAFLMTYVGMPLLYYGDEIALEGADMLEGRQAMRWRFTPEEEEMHSWFRRLIHIRRAHPALMRGVFMPAAPDSKSCTAAFRRETAEERLLCLFHNAGGEAAYPLDGLADGIYEDLLTGERFSGGEAVPLAPYGFRLLRAEACV